MMMIAFRSILLLSSLLVLCVIADNDDASLFPLNNIGDFTADQLFMDKGFNKELNATCSVQLFGTPESAACGQRDLASIQKIFVKKFNKNQKRKARKAKIDTTGIMAYETEAVDQYIDSGDRRRVLGSAEDENAERRLFNFHFNIIGVRAWMICNDSFCNKDNGDARRRLQNQQRNLAVKSVAQMIKDGLIAKKRRTYFDSLQCVRVTCDGSSYVEESDGCESFPDVLSVIDDIGTDGLVQEDGVIDDAGTDGAADQNGY